MKLFKDKHGRLRCVVELQGDKKSKLYIYGDKNKSEEMQIKEIVTSLKSRNLFRSEVF